MFATGSVWDYWPVLLRGMGLTVAISMLAMAGGLVIGLLVGTLRTYGPRPLRLACRAYTEMFRSIPPLLLFFGAFYGLSYGAGIHLTPFAAAVAALTVEASALLSEVVRGALQSVGPGQWDAAHALGLRFQTALVRVALPQAVRVAVPPGIGVAVAVLKDSSFASVVGLLELTRSSLMVRDAVGDSLTVFLLLATAYFVLSFTLSMAGAHLERRAYRHVLA